MGNRLRQTVHTHRASVHQTTKLVAALLRVARVTAGLAESNGSLSLTAKNREQLKNPTLGNGVWATFFTFIRYRYLDHSWWRGTVVERRSLAGELSLSCARPAADG